MNRIQQAVHFDFIYVGDDHFTQYKPRSFTELMQGFTKYKERED